MFDSSNPTRLTTEPATKAGLSDDELNQISGGVSNDSGWGKTINPFDGTVGGSDDWGKTVDPFAP